MIQYRVGGGATRQTHYCSRTFENGVRIVSCVARGFESMRGFDFAGTTQSVAELRSHAELGNEERRE
jgi:hypothetical protein